MSQIIQHHAIVPEACRGMRLDLALSKMFPQYSRSLLQKWLKCGYILLDNHNLPGKHLIIGQETVTINVIGVNKPNLHIAQHIPLNIIYEDEYLLVINKPAGLIVHPGNGNPANTLLNALLHYNHTLNLLPRAGIVHRLDKDTTGLLVVAKNMVAYHSLVQQLKTRSMCRKYQALICGQVIAGNTIDAPIGRNPIKRKQMSVQPQGKVAITHYRVLEKYSNLTRIQVALATGRTHQIRVHMQHIRHPIFADPVYGQRLQLPPQADPQLIEKLRQFKRQALHAHELGLIHPKTNTAITWKIALPDDLQQLILLLQRSTAPH